MIFAKIENGIIVEKVSASNKPEGYELDKKGISRVGERRDIFDTDWNPKPLETLVKENILSIPEGFKIENNDFVELSDDEKVKARIIKPSNHEKVVDGKIVPKTIEELYKDKIITSKEYNEYIVECRANAFAKETDPLFWDYQEGKITKDEWVKAKEVIRNKYKKVK